MAPAFLILMLLGGCASIDEHERVAGWPELEIHEHRVEGREMLERCRKYVGFGAVPLACAEFNLQARRCDIWLNRAFAPKTIVEHERMHCHGYDHVGSTGMRDFLTRYQESTSAAGGTTRQ